MPITINGTGSINGLSAGGLPDGSVTPPDLSQPLTLETAKPATGTSIDFTGIPSWVKRITVMFNAVSTNGTNTISVQVGSGSIAASGYSGTIWTSTTSTQVTTAFPVFNPIGAANNAVGMIVLAHMGSNVWSQSGNLAFGNTNSTGWSSAGILSSLSGALDRVRITAGGVDTFDGGTINILYE